MGWGAAEAHATLPLHPNHAKTPACPNIQCRRVPRARGFATRPAMPLTGSLKVSRPPVQHKMVKKVPSNQRQTKSSSHMHEQAVPLTGRQS